MKTKTNRLFAGSLICLLVFSVAATSTRAQETITAAEAAALRKTVSDMQQTINQLNARLNQVENTQVIAPAAANVRTQPGVPLSQNMSSTSTATSPYSTDQTYTTAPNAAPYQPLPATETTPALAAEASFLGGDGFIPVPRTGLKFRFNLKPRVDMTYDNEYTGNNDRFVTAQIPTDAPYDTANDNTGRFNANVRGSQIKFDVRSLDPDNNFRLYYENDFFAGGTNGGNELRLRQFYVTYKALTFGYTFSSFEDPDVWPDTVDYEGPNSATFARWPLIRYRIQLDEKLALNLSIEKPDSQIDGTGDPGLLQRNRAPDFAGNLRWEDPKVGHIQFSGVVRSIGAQSTVYGDDDVISWGLNLSGVFNLGPADSIQLQATYGGGIFRYANDNFFNNDGAYDSRGNLRAILYMAGLIGYTHKWNDSWRSSASYGHVDIDNQASQAPNNYHTTDYASLNLVWTPYKRLDIGAEILYGRRETKDGYSGDALRFQISVIYSLF